jgi:hypothetical protein
MRGTGVFFCFVFCHGTENEEAIHDKTPPADSGWPAMPDWPTGAVSGYLGRCVGLAAALRAEDVQPKAFLGLGVFAEDWHAEVLFFGETGVVRAKDFQPDAFFLAGCLVGFFLLGKGMAFIFRQHLGMTHENTFAFIGVGFMEIIMVCHGLSP